MRLPTPGERVGPYVCERLLASGGMGAVFEARHFELGRAVALKVLLAPDDPELVARFEREAEACARLDHPNLVGVYDAGVSGGTCYLALELVDGESLQDQLSRGGPFEEARALSAIREAVQGISHAHGVGVLHRDLKPANLLWDRVSGSVRVVDFGLTGRLRQADALTVTGEVLGTPGYLAPEQATGETQHAGPRTDVYGLGATLFALLAGRPPFVAPGLAGLAEVAQDPPPSLRDLRPEVSPAVAAAVAKSLAKDPADRWSSAEAFGEALAGLSSGARPSKGRALLALFAALVLAALPLTALWLGPSQPSLSAMEDYRAWRAKGFDAFLWEGREEGARLEEWGTSLLTLEESPERDQALGEVQALARLSRARREGWPAALASGAAPPREALVQAVIEAEALRRESAARALELVPERQRSSREFSSCSAIVESLVDAKAYERGLRRRGPTRAWALRVFPRALAHFAQRESASTLIRVFRTGKGVGASEPERALQAALEASVEERLEELGRARGGEAEYLRRLCAPLREVGLWPKERFAAALRADFTEQVRIDPETDVSALRLLLYEHELFYRVDPTRANRDFAVGVLLQLTGIKVHGAHANRTLDRTRTRYGGSAKDRQQGPGTIPSWVEIVGRLSEPGSRLDAAAAWWRELIRDEVDLSSAQQGLLEVLSIETNDLDPAISVNMLREVARLWSKAAPSRSPKWRALAEQAERIGWSEFEGALSWQVEFPIHSLTSAMVDGLGFAAGGHLRTGRPELALACYEKALEAVDRAIKGVEGKADEGTLRSGLTKTLISIYSRLAAATTAAGIQVQALEVLEGAIPYLKRAAPHVRDALWSALLVGYVGVGKLEKAEELARPLGDGSGYSYRLVLALVAVRLESDQIKEAQALLGQAERILDQADAALADTREPEIDPERVVELRIARQRVAELRRKVEVGLESQAAQPAPGDR